MKKISAFIALLLVFTMMLTASAATVKLAYTGGSIRLHSESNTSSSTLAYLKNGNTVTVLNKGSVWSKIETSSGKKGYIKSLYLSGIGSQYADGTSYAIRGTYYVTTKHSGSKVNMRGGASTSCGIITALGSGTAVKVLGKNGSWYLVETSGGTQGFMSASYLSAKKGSSSSGSSDTFKAKVTAESGLNLRKGPGEEYARIATIKKDTVVKVTSTANSRWWKVEYGSSTGYMAKNFLKKV